MLVHVVVTENDLFVKLDYYLAYNYINLIINVPAHEHMDIHRFEMIVFWNMYLLTYKSDLQQRC